MYWRTIVRIALIIGGFVDPGSGQCDSALPQETRNDAFIGKQSAKTPADDNASRPYKGPDNLQLRAINVDDPANVVVKNLLVSIQNRYAEDPLVRAQVDYSGELIGHATRELFPGYRFFVCQWTEKPRNPSAFVCGTVFLEALCLDGKFESTRFRSVSNRKEFGILLAKEKIKITGEASARLAWDAFCEVYRWPFKTDKIEQISDRVWHLGIVDSDPQEPGEAYYEVRLNEDSTVASARWINSGARDIDRDEQELVTDTPSRQEILEAWVKGKPLRIPFMPDPAQLHAIDKHDPAAKVVAAYVDRIKQKFAAEATDCREMKGPAASRLFPDYRFFVCHWNDSSAFNVDSIVLDKHLKLTTIGPFVRLDEDFGQFAARHKVRVTDEKDALLVWDAFCEIRRWYPKSNTVQRVSDRIWRLGAIPSGNEHAKAYFEIRLDDQGVVESAKWTIEGARDVYRRAPK